MSTIWLSLLWTSLWSFLRSMVTIVIFTLYIEFIVHVATPDVFRCFFFKMSYIGIARWVLVFEAYFRSKRPFELDSTVNCIFYLFCLVTSPRIFRTFCPCFFILQRKCAMNRQTSRQTSTDAQVDHHRISETQSGVSHQGVGGRQGEGRVHGWGRMCIMTLRASICEGTSMTVMGGNGRRVNVYGDSFTSTKTDVSE